MLFVLTCSGLHGPQFDETRCNAMNKMSQADVKGLGATTDGTSFAFPPLSPAAQELIVAGGAENLVASRLRAKP